MSQAEYFFHQGTNIRAYDYMGAHRLEDGSVVFRVWAPNAKEIFLCGDHNGWAKDTPLTRENISGIWSVTLPEFKEGTRYKYLVCGNNGDHLKADPYGFYAETGMQTATVFHTLKDFEWTDEEFIKSRQIFALCREYDEMPSAPVNIYEMHLGSWMKKEDGSYLSYRELADKLAEYVSDMNYTHVEIMPIAEHPFDGSWGYQVCGYYAPTSRFGTPEDFMYFVNKLHSKGIGVILDWVPAHFPKDEHALARFDGTALFEHPDSRLGEHKEWGTLVFNWQKSEVHSFLISNAIFWLDEYHFDGLRVDAVSSMLYLDYNRRDGEWIANKYGGNENIEAIEFLQKLNIAVFERFPNAIMVAEESTAWGGVTKPAHEGGLGFNYKWNMGWMNDILRYMSMDPYFRGPNHNMLTFSMMYAYAENYILALSHDEVVHGKRSLIDKMSGNYEQKFASLRLLYAYMYAHPGKKLLFMGDEFGQFIEWRYCEGLEWKLMEYDKHAQLLEFSRHLGEFYKNHKAMHQNDSDWDGFRWINAEDGAHNTVTFMRISRSRREKIIVAANFSGQSHENYAVGVPSAGVYEVVLNTNSTEFGGSDKDTRLYTAKKQRYGDFPYTIEIDIPELTAYYIKRKKTKKG